jgi:membrane-bound lytic murein transglycosylase D
LNEVFAQRIPVAGGKVKRFFLPCLILVFSLIGCAHQSEYSSRTIPNDPSISSHPNAIYSKSKQSAKGARNKNYADGKTQKIGKKSLNPSDDEYPSESLNEDCPQIRHDLNSSLNRAFEYCNLSKEFKSRGELDQALQALDQAYSLILDIDEADGGEVVQQKEDLRFTISKRILEIYASRTIALPGDRKAIPIDLNSRVMDEVHSFTEGSEKDFFMAAYARSGKYRPIIVKALEEAGLPVELSWLPLIESGFKSSALSPARALGLWQFIASTGYRYGLSRNKYVDERMDFEKSTLAAIAYLKDLHELFGDWETVLAAYNCGEGKILRTIRDQNINYLDNFWDLYDRLPVETARYVPRFIAVLHIVNNPKKYDLDDVSMEPPLTYETVELSQMINLKDISSGIGISDSLIEELNPELRYQILPGEPYKLRIPSGYKETLLAAIDDMPEHTPPKPAYVLHRVTDGETMASIADQFQVTPEEIVSSNKLGKSGRTVVGQRLKIPLRSEENDDPLAHATASIEKTTQNHTPKKEEPKAQNSHEQNPPNKPSKTVKKPEPPAKKEKNNNCMKSKDQKYQAIIASASANHNKTFRAYRVQNGDSPISIANLYKMNLDRFLEINQIKHTTKLFPGQTLFVE